jgi:glycosyltransferase involved in cell wall biosynthesis
MAPYNYGRFIETALEHVLKQTLTDFEVIIGDNASTDDTEARVKPFLQDPRVQYFRNEENVGICKNFNRCFHKMHPESRYFIGLPADDYWHETLLEQLVKLAEAHPDVTVIYSDGYRFEDASEDSDEGKGTGEGSKEGRGDVYGKYTDVFTTPSPPTGRHRALRELYQNNYIPFQAALVKLEHFKHYYPHVDPYFDAVPNINDYHLWLQLMSRGAVVYFHPEPLAYVRKHGQALTTERNIIPRLRQEYWLLEHIRDITPPQLEASRAFEQRNRGKRLLFKLMESGQIKAAREVLQSLQKRHLPERDVRVASWVLALPVSADLRARMWSIINFVYKLNTLRRTRKRLT